MLTVCKRNNKGNELEGRKRDWVDKLDNLNVCLLTSMGRNEGQLVFLRRISVIHCYINSTT